MIEIINVWNVFDLNSLYHWHGLLNTYDFVYFYIAFEPEGTISPENVCVRLDIPRNNDK